MGNLVGFFRELRDKMNAKFEQMRKIIPSASTTTAKVRKTSTKMIIRYVSILPPSI